MSADNDTLQTLPGSTPAVKPPAIVVFLSLKMAATFAVSSDDGTKSKIVEVAGDINELSKAAFVDAYHKALERFEQLKAHP